MIEDLAYTTLFFGPIAIGSVWGFIRGYRLAREEGMNFIGQVLFPVAGVFAGAFLGNLCFWFLMLLWAIAMRILGYGP